MMGEAGLADFVAHCLNPSPAAVSAADLANMYSMSKFTISTILLVFLVDYAYYATLFLL
jgi:hypothetical protein